MKANIQRLFMTAIISSLLLSAFIGGCKKDDYVEVKGICPLVIRTSPISNATLVPRNQVITATFNEKMDPASFSQASFTLEGVTKAGFPVTGIVSYSIADSSLRFVPGSALALATTYTGTVKATVKDLKGNVLQADYVWAFSTGPIVAPVVTLTDPANLASNIALNKVVTATFSVAMDPLTINTTTFTLKQGTTAISGTVTYSGTTASFTPTVSLAPNTIYTATITTGAQNADGTPLQANYVWTFTSGAAPTVISTDPVNNATGVILNKIVTATFSVPMDPATITATTFTLNRGATAVAGTVTYTGSTASFTPSSPLILNTVYTGTITTGAKNIAGTSLQANYVWTFTTGAAPTVISTDPLNNATGVALNKIVAATFSVPMDPLTIIAATFTLKQGATSVAGTVTYTGSTASFAPTSALAPNTIYTATITTGARNVAGISLANDYVWSFTTQAGAILPFVDLKTADRFGILAGVGISNNAGFSEIRDMDVGISPGVRSSVTGFPPAKVVNGAIYCSDDIAPPGVPAMLTQAKQDLTDAYLFAEGATSPAPATVAGDLGGQTLTPGIYKSTSTLLIQSGDLTLDAQGDANAFWIFQIASDFTTIGGAGGNVILSGNAQAKNVFWQVGSSAVIGDFTSFRGNILALTSITMNSGATAQGRMLARNGAVVMTNANIITKP